jgi:hypothetical protein
MKIKYFLFLALSLLTITIRPEEAALTTIYTVNIDNDVPSSAETAESPKDTINQKTGLKELCKKYLVSIIPGTMIGATTGYLEKYIEKQFGIAFPKTLLFMIIEYGIRNKTVDTVQKDCDKHFVNNSRELMFFAARLASWIAYFS